MSLPENIDQVYGNNPITSNDPGDLIYIGRSPYGATDDAAILFSDFAAQFGAAYTPAALTETSDTNVILTLGGAPTTALLQATSITVSWSGLLGLARGGTNANLTAAAGGITYSTASALALSAAGTSGQLFQSAGTNAPVWTTNTYPSTDSKGDILYASAANTIGGLAIGSTGNILTISSGLPAWTTATYPATTTVNQILYSSSANVIGGITTANNGVMITGTTGTPSFLANSGTAGFVLTANSGAPPSWQAASSGGITSSGIASGQVLIANSTSSAISSANFTWDNTNNSLAVGNSATTNGKTNAFGLGTNCNPQFNGCFIIGDGANSAAGGTQTNQFEASFTNGFLFKSAGFAVIEIDNQQNIITRSPTYDQDVFYQIPVTGFTITINGGASRYLLDPAGTLATGTIILPGNASTIDGKIISFSSSQIITSLTIQANTGQSLANGMPTTITAGQGYSFIFKNSNSTWYRLY